MFFVEKYGHKQESNETMIFGAASIPFLTQSVKNYNAAIHEKVVNWLVNALK
jgi:hypothetical protein